MKRQTQGGDFCHTSRCHRTGDLAFASRKLPRQDAFKGFFSIMMQHQFYNQRLIGRPGIFGKSCQRHRRSEKDRWGNHCFHARLHIIKAVQPTDKCLSLTGIILNPQKGDSCAGRRSQKAFNLGFVHQSVCLQRDTIEVRHEAHHIGRFTLLTQDFKIPRTQQACIFRNFPIIIRIDRPLTDFMCNCRQRRFPIPLLIIPIRPRLQPLANHADTRIGMGDDEIVAGGDLPRSRGGIQMTIVVFFAGFHPLIQHRKV